MALAYMTDAFLPCQIEPGVASGVLPDRALSAQFPFLSTTEIGVVPLLEKREITAKSAKPERQSIRKDENIRRTVT
jgi:hypothetical protein